MSILSANGIGWGLRDDQRVPGLFNLIMPVLAGGHEAGSVKRGKPRVDIHN